MGRRKRRKGSRNEPTDDPEAYQGLPPTIAGMILQAFVGATGFSRGEVLRFFEPYYRHPVKALALSIDRVELFLHCYAHVPPGRQREVLASLLHYTGSMRHGAPAAEAVARIEQYFLGRCPGCSHRLSGSPVEIQRHLDGCCDDAWVLPRFLAERHRTSPVFAVPENQVWGRFRGWFPHPVRKGERSHR